ncbi:MAG: 30S ribosomal protein S9, partial [bacterium]|nr:30S ribosomal protein S9 [bacterium]
MSIVQYYGTGRRKTSIARVYLRPGKGEFKLVVNKRKRV